MALIVYSLRKLREGKELTLITTFTVFMGQYGEGQNKMEFSIGRSYWYYWKSAGQQDIL